MFNLCCSLNELLVNAFLAMMSMLSLSRTLVNKENTSQDTKTSYFLEIRSLGLQRMRRSQRLCFLSDDVYHQAT